MSTAVIASDRSPLADLILRAHDAAGELIIFAGVAPDGTDEFNEIVSRFVDENTRQEPKRTVTSSVKAGELDDAIVSVTTDCMYAAYALGVAVGLRIGGDR